MAEKLARIDVAAKARIHTSLPEAIAADQRAPHAVDRTFELPGALYAATVGLYFAIIAVMGLGFANPEMAIPIAICVVFVIGVFGTPALWTRLAPGTKSRAMTMGQFRQHGIQTITGHLSAGQASVQMLILPVLILMWALITVTIAALV